MFLGLLRPIVNLTEGRFGIANYFGEYFDCSCHSIYAFQTCLQLAECQTRFAPPSRSLSELSELKGCLRIN